MMELAALRASEGGAYREQVACIGIQILITRRTGGFESTEDEGFINAPRE